MNAYMVVAALATFALLWAARSGAWTERAAAARVWAAVQTGELGAALAVERATVAARADLAAWCLARADAAPAELRATGHATGRAWCREAEAVALLAAAEARLDSRSAGLREDLARLLAAALAAACGNAPGAWTARALALLARSLQREGCHGRS